MTLARFGGQLWHDARFVLANCSATAQVLCANLFWEMKQNFSGLC